MNRSCSECRAPILESQRFCRFCGHRVDQGIQDFVATEALDNGPSFEGPSLQTSALDPELSPPVGKETIPLVRRQRESGLLCALASLCCLGSKSSDGPRRRRVLYGIIALILLSVLGFGVVRLSVPGDSYERIEADLGEHVGAVWQPAVAPLPPAAPPAPPSKPAPEPPNPPTTSTPRAASSNQLQRIDRLLLTHAAHVEQRAERLRRQLDEGDGLSEQERRELVVELRALEKQRLGLVAAAHALRSERLQRLLQKIVPVDEILHEVAVELERQHIRIDLDDLDALLDQ